MVDVHNLSGHIVAGWLLGNILGSGADGIVYEAIREELHAGVKIFFPDILERNGLESGLERLELQLQLKGMKHHPNLVEIYEGGLIDEWNTIYIAMEKVAGISLDVAIGNLSKHDIPLLLGQLASAAKFLESIGLVHRDIKPANIMISENHKCLTLLDLGIVLRHLEKDDERLSGDEFIATTRYSPPEFVWRNEESDDEEAWRAITFYQIGATLHDMVMGFPLFKGNDKPRAKLYDAVRLMPPLIKNEEMPQWICLLAKCCLVKNWRERLQLVSWSNFDGDSTSSDNVEKLVRKIKLTQIVAEEESNFVSASMQNSQIDLRNRRAQDLWDLQGKVFLEVRRFLIDSKIFPKFKGTQNPIKENKYILSFVFEVDKNRLFNEELTVNVELSTNENQEIAFTLYIDAHLSFGKEIFSGRWIEMLSVGTASAIVQQAFLEITNGIISENSGS